MAESRFNKGWHRAVNAATFGYSLRPNQHEHFRAAQDGQSFFICDGLATIQGPNYALAKRLQHWRAMLADSEGVKVSSNIAPATFTASVEHNNLTFAISRAVSTFEPIEVFDKETTKALMALLLLHDLQSNGHGALRNPLELMSTTEVDCGVWRAGVQIGSTGEISALIYGVGTALSAVGLPSPLVDRPTSKL